ncbi:MAG TPA: chromate transporter [Candidatus Gemmiger faecigallinarum]|nr:chromate transporter [Candidatus Gemmiger faecigallinarum]
MAQTRNKYLTLFLSTLQLSAFTFGGGFVIIPLMRKKFVEKLHWIDEQEMMDFAAIAQSSPGAIAVNASILVGYRIAGVPGALVTVAGTVLPPLVILSVISFFYAAFRSNPIVSMAMAGMSAGVAAVICDVVYTMGLSVIRQKRVLPVAVMAAAFAAACFFDVNVVVIILVCGAVGAWDTWRRAGQGKEQKK